MELELLAKIQQELKKEKDALVIQQESLQENVRNKTCAATVQRFKFAATLARERKQQEETAKQIDSLKQHKVVEKFKSVSKFLKAERDQTKMEQMEKTNQSLREELKKATAEIESLHLLLDDTTTELKHLNLQLQARNEELKKKMTNELIAKDIIFCEICMKEKAVVRCIECNEVMCPLCDIRQHKPLQMFRHQRLLFTIEQKPKEGTLMCDFCGIEPVAVHCFECEAGRLCTACDEMKHLNPKRSFHSRRSVRNMVPIPPYLHTTFPDVKKRKAYRPIQMAADQSNSSQTPKAYQLRRSSHIVYY